MQPGKKTLPETSMKRYDWSKATRGRFAGKVARGDAWRRLADDVAAEYPTADSVNDALRFVLALRKAGATLPGLAKPKRTRKAA